MATPWVTSFTASTQRTDAIWAGHRFTVGSSAITVTDLGYWVIAAGGAHTVRINRVSDGVEMCSVSVNTAGAPTGAYKYAAITPVVLAASTQYYITGLHGTDAWYDYPTSPVVTGVATNDGAVYATTGAPNTFNYSGNNSAQAWGPLNFKYDTAQPVAPTGIASREEFGSPAVTSVAKVLPSGVTTAEVSGKATVTSVAKVLPAGVMTREAVGTPTAVRGAVVVAPTGVATREALGTPVVTAAAGPTQVITLNKPFSDDFEDGVIAPEWFSVVGSVTETGGRLVVDSTGGGYQWVDTLDIAGLANSSFTVEVPVVASGGDGGDSFLSVYFNGGSTFLLIGEHTGVLYTDVWDAGNNVETLTYNATDHRWWRIREAAGTVYFEVSPDGTTWTVVRSLPTPNWGLAVDFVELGSGAWGATAPTVIAEFERYIYDSPGVFASDETFGNPVVVRATDTTLVAPAGVPSREAAGTPAVVPGAVAVVLIGTPTEAAVGTAVVKTTNVVAPAGVPSEARTNPATVTSVAVVLPAGVGTAERTGAVVVLGSVQTIAPAGIATAAATNPPTVVTGAVSVFPKGIPTDAAFGESDIVAIARAVALASAEAFGSVKLNQTIAVAGIASREAFATAVVFTGSITLKPVSLATREALGAVVVLRGPVTRTVTGIPTAETVGKIVLTMAEISALLTSYVERATKFIVKVEEDSSGSSYVGADSPETSHANRGL